MKPALLLFLATAAALHAGPTDSAIVAAMKLPDAKSYRWIATIEDDARTYQIAGQTGPDDFSLVTMPMPAALRRRISRSTANSDNQVEVVFRGAEDCVIQTPDGWKTPAELARGAQSSAGAGGEIGLPPVPNRRSRTGDPPRAYSNLQLNLSRPHEELGIIVGSYTDIKAEVEGDVVSGTLSETGAKLLLVHPGQDELTPLSASGTFRLWVRDGALVKYEVRLTGTLAVETPSARREIVVHQKSTTELTGVGTTKFAVPEEARRKFSG